MTDEKDYKSVPSSVVVDFDENNLLDVDEVSETGSSRSRLKAIAKKIIAARRLLTGEINFTKFIHFPCSIFISDFSEGFLEKDRPDKTKVRWINVDGISWDVIKTLALKFDLHPLSIEDALQNTQRTKRDQYQNHIYISLLLHTLNHDDVKCELERDNSSMIEGKENTKSFSYNSRKDLLLHGHQEGSKYLETHKILRRQKLNVYVEQVSIFLLKDETLLTIFQHNGKSVYKPILARINQPKTLLRTAHDASLLMEAVIDTIVDLTLGPVQSLVTILREHEEKKDFITPLAKTYFMDVADHCNEIVDNLDTMTNISENLVNLVNFGMNFHTFDALDYPLR
nr:5021_t:CDS:10 [Entrophospora candida]CAG8517132.1 12617_t:CDS:10 [Entrophospora candida]